MAASQGNAVIGQSGGPTSVINQSLVGVIREIRSNNLVGQLLGARHGVRGIINGDFIALKEAPDELLSRIAQTPAAALGSTRDKPDQAYCEKIFQSFAKHNGYSAVGPHVNRLVALSPSAVTSRLSDRTSSCLSSLPW